jgi:hypothetical protein
VGQRLSQPDLLPDEIWQHPEEFPGVLLFESSGTVDRAGYWIEKMLPEPKT